MPLQRRSEPAPHTVLASPEEGADADDPMMMQLAADSFELELAGDDLQLFNNMAAGLLGSPSFTLGAVAALLIVARHAWPAHLSRHRVFAFVPVQKLQYGGGQGSMRSGPAVIHLRTSAFFLLARVPKVSQGQAEVCWYQVQPFSHGRTRSRGIALCALLMSHS